MNQVNTDIGRIVTGAKRDPMEVLLGAGIISGIQAILTHCSPEIFKVHEYVYEFVSYMYRYTCSSNITIMVAVRRIHYSYVL